MSSAPQADYPSQQQQQQQVQSHQNRPPFRGQHAAKQPGLQPNPLDGMLSLLKTQVAKLEQPVEMEVDVEALSSQDLTKMLRDLEFQLSSVPASLPKVRAVIVAEIEAVKERKKQPGQLHKDWPV